MKRYILFADYAYYPNGGSGDIKEVTESLKDFKSDLKKLVDNYDSVYIYDIQTSEEIDLANGDLNKFLLKYNY
jgi:hypothetical protein